MRKKTILCASIIFLFLATSAFAKIWQINNNSGVKADFSQLQHANDDAAVMDGDTLYVAGSSNTYLGLNASKKLIIIGPGYFLDENPDTQAVTKSAKTGHITFDEGSDGSVITGCDISPSLTNNNMHAVKVSGADNITIERNMIQDATFFGVLFECLIVEGGRTNILITQNYIVNSFGPTAGTSAIRVEADAEVRIINNYIERTEIGFEAIDVSSAGEASIEVRNNVIKGNLILNNTDFRNNILREGILDLTGTGNTFEYNIANQQQLPAAPGNNNGVNMSLVFMGPGTTDDQWQLKPGSPAIDAGDLATANDPDGTRADIGMYGSGTPYVLSGVPAIPAIYSYTASPRTATALPITFSAKSNK